ncbi:hypothetical protein F2Q65_00985 [Thiohalocapsa marina]|uniref:IS66 family transposase n=1 Tax=Thiohalocapsa marina TaxID=424902 RepID=A0A5M8FVL7_9GAMM|nr:hypothetical protein [Thiohalocapsa marina]KAA6187846.1 hypothetical protein F2Q65_00985 [Thiohalocapsa marina]
MKLSQHDLQQLDEGHLQGLLEATLRRLSVTLLADLKEGRERLQQHPGNSSRPPSCRAKRKSGKQPRVPGTVYTGFQSIDLRRGDPSVPGLQLEVVDHRYLEVTCGCGHSTRAQPAQGAVEETLEGLALGEWRLVGPGLAGFIVV